MSSISSNKEATCWEEAYPIGNGSLGAMISGGYEEDHLWLNEDSVWYGKPLERENPEARLHLAEVREKILSGHADEAEEILKHTFTAIPESQRIYQPLGDCFIRLKNPSRLINCRRELNLQEAICKVEYETAVGKIVKEYFASNPGKAIFVRLTAEHGEKLNLEVYLKRENFQDEVRMEESGRIYLTGSLGQGGLEFSLGAQIRTEGGTAERIGEYLVVREAESVLLCLTGSTTFYYKENLQESLANILQEGMSRSYCDIREEHVKDYQSLFSRISLEIETDAANTDFPTAERLAQVRTEKKADGAMANLYFDFGRYLLISCSRKGGFPANLQGLWNHRIAPPWESKYTININTEMNYWPAWNCGLDVCTEPLFALLKRMRERGKITAQKMYGCRGFVAHHNTDVWADTAPQDTYIPATYWPMGGAWLSFLIWERYEYTLDVEWLRENYSVLEDAVQFFIDFLVEDEGEYVTCPSVSPENTYIMENGKTACVCAGPTMDTEILTDLFHAYLNAAKVLQIEDGQTKQAEMILAKLPPLRIGCHGQIMEWRRDYEETEPGHRHISQLYALFPSQQITPETPELYQAAAKTLERRLSYGSGHTGWSCAWLVNLYARLGNGEKAWQMLEKLWAESTFDTMMDNHPHVIGPVFQIDGNLGGVSGILQMLVQDYGHKVLLLPACPKEWRKGKLEGITLKGCATLSIFWDENTVKGSVKADADWNGTICFCNQTVQIQLKAGESQEF